MDLTKVHLSPSELQFVQNAALLLTKNTIIEKVYLLFGQLAEHIRASGIYPGNLPQDVFAASPKISRGENYKGLPYVMLDYPRCFGKENILAVRSFFWWGNYFTVTLHIKGMYKEMLMPKLEKALPELTTEGFYWWAGEDEWDQELSTAGYSDKYDSTDLKKRSNVPGMAVKLAARIEFDQWNGLYRRLTGLHHTIGKIIAD